MRNRLAVVLALPFLACTGQGPETSTDVGPDAIDHPETRSQDAFLPDTEGSDTRAPEVAADSSEDWQGQDAGLDLHVVDLVEPDWSTDVGDDVQSADQSDGQTICENCALHYFDEDGDGFGVDDDSVCVCLPYGPYRAQQPGDCDDNDPLVHPGAAPICGIDADCDGSPQEAGEACDDGNGVDWDGCADCQVTEYRLNEVTAGNQMLLSLVGTHEGGFLGIWEGVGLGGERGLWAHLFGPSGLSLGVDFRIDVDGVGQELDSGAEACLLSDDTVLVAWRGYHAEGIGKEILIRRFDLSGQALGPPQLVNLYLAGGQADPSLACRHEGGFLVAFSGNADAYDDTEIYLRAYDDQAQPLGPPIMANVWQPGLQHSPALTLLESGEYMLAWTYMEDELGAPNYGVLARHVDAMGQPYGDEFCVNDGYAIFEEGPALSSVPGGGWVVLWQSETPAPWWGEVHGKVYDGDGGLLMEETRINDYNLECQDSPRPLFVGQGLFAATYRSAELDGSGWAIGLRLYDMEDHVFGEELIANVFTQGNQQYPRITHLEGDELLVGWTSAGQDGSGNGVYVQRFNSSGERLFR